MRILLDVTRTLVHSRKRTPTGIDRVEHAYVRHLLSQQKPSDTWFIANTPFGRGALSSTEMRALFEKIESIHRQTDGGPAGKGFAQLSTALACPIPTDRTVPLTIRGVGPRDRDAKAAVMAAYLKGAAQFRRLMRDGAPSIYLHTSHLQLDEARCFQWLARNNVFPVFFIHDLIPIEFPEFCAPGAATRHELRIETALTHARALIVNSAFTRESLARHAGAGRLPPIAVVPLANTIREFPRANIPRLSCGAPYFLHVGTIEGRKNIGHLLTVWRRIIGAMGPHSAPRLVLVGRRGWECDNVISMLDRSRELANHIIEVSDISDSELDVLLRQAAGLISVSMTEGYGLPPVEAARRGVPVIASDIPAHREILGSTARFVHVHDGEALARHITALAKGDPDRDNPAEYLPFNWTQHVEQALAFIRANVAVQTL